MENSIWIVLKELIFDSDLSAEDKNSWFPVIESLEANEVEVIFELLAEDPTLLRPLTENLKAKLALASGRGLLSIDKLLEAESALIFQKSPPR